MTSWYMVMVKLWAIALKKDRDWLLDSLVLYVCELCGIRLEISPAIGRCHRLFKLTCQLHCNYFSPSGLLLGHLRQSIAVCAALLSLHISLAECCTSIIVGKGSATDSICVTSKKPRPEQLTFWLRVWFGHVTCSVLSGARGRAKKETKWRFRFVYFMSYFLNSRPSWSWKFYPSHGTTARHTYPSLQLVCKSQIYGLTDRF